jgi:hypothetical protein
VEGPEKPFFSFISSSSPSTTTTGRLTILIGLLFIIINEVNIGKVFQSYFSNKLNNILSNELNNIKTLSNALFGEEVERHWTLCCYYWHHLRR